MDPYKLFIVKIDASATTIGSFLLQEIHPITFEGKKLIFVQCNYLAYDCKLFAITHDLKKWNHYVYGAKFEVAFDHKSIK